MKTSLILALAVAAPLSFAGTTYRYNAYESSCMNRNYDFGYNQGSLGECQDLRDIDVSTIVLKGNNRGINISGSVDFWEDDLSARKQKKIGGLKAIKGSDLSGINLSNTNGVETENLVPSKVTLSGVKMRGAKASDSNLYRANLSNSDLSGLEAYNSILIRSNLSNAQIDAAKFNNANMTNVNLEKVKGAANFRNTNLTNANFKNSILHNLHNQNKFGQRRYKVAADFQGTILKNADLRGADLTGSNLKLAKDLNGAKFDITQSQLLPFSIEYALKRGMIPYIGDKKLTENEMRIYLQGFKGNSYMYPLTSMIEGERPFGVVDDTRKLGKDFDSFTSSEGYRYNSETGEYKNSFGSFSISN